MIAEIVRIVYVVRLKVVRLNYLLLSLVNSMNININCTFVPLLFKRLPYGLCFST